MNTTRMEAFSDGVFAIIITIMVLEIKIPRGADWSSLTSQVPVFISYILSFLFIGIYWGNHHHLLHVVKRISPGLLWANLHLLFWLSLVPVVTGWVGENHFATNTIVAYAFVLLMCGLSYTIMQLLIQKNHQLTPEMEQALKKVRTKGFISLIAYSSAIPIAFLNTTLSGLIFFLVAILWLVPERNIEKALHE